MFHNDWTARRLARDRQRELIREAAQERLVRQAGRKAGRQSSRLAAWLGRQLIAAGQRLQADRKTTMTAAALRPARRSR
jgi:predicted ATP-dependent protease